MVQWEILGCGGSMGVPMIGCDCAICTSDDPRNQRCRTSAVIRSASTTVLIDAGPDLRFQALRAGLRHIDAVAFTHPHQDHIAGVDDLRPWSFKHETKLPIYGNAFTLQRLRHQYDYAFAPEEGLSTRPRMELREIDTEPFTIGDLTITPLPIWHGDWLIRGFRVGAVAYVTDVKTIPDATRPLLENLDTLMIGALRYEPHPLHMSIDEALAEVERIQPRQAFFVHLAHNLDYAETNARLPDHVRLAHDGLVIADPA